METYEDRLAWCQSKRGGTIFSHAELKGKGVGRDIEKLIKEKVIARVCIGWYITEGYELSDSLAYTLTKQMFNYLNIDYVFENFRFYVTRYTLPHIQFKYYVVETTRVTKTELAYMKGKERPLTIREKIENRLQTTTVCVPQDFYDIGSAQSVWRTLEQLSEEEQLVRITKGIYVKTVPQEGGPPKFSACNFIVARLILRRLGLCFAHKEALTFYVNKRCTRTIKYGEFHMRLEYVT